MYLRKKDHIFEIELTRHEPFGQSIQQIPGQVQRFDCGAQPQPLWQMQQPVVRQIEPRDALVEQVQGDVR